MGGIRDKYMRSRRIRKDPTQTLSLIHQYERSLVKLFRATKQPLREAFKEAQHQATLSSPSLGQRSLQFSLAMFGPNVDKIFLRVVKEPAQDLCSEYARQAYQRGILRSDQYLRAGGLEPLGDGITLPADRVAIEAVVERNIAALYKVSDDTAAAIKQVVSDGILRGEGYKAIQYDVLDRVDKIGVHRARLVARSETQAAYHAASTQRYKSVGVAQVEWYTAGDERVCPECDVRDGQIYSLDDITIPLHPDCRCDKLPYKLVSGEVI